MNTPPATVFVIDDDSAVRDALSMLIEQQGLAVETHESAASFLAVAPAEMRGCAVIDVRMPEMDGLELQAEMARRGSPLPVIFLTGHGDIPTSVRAIKAGAVNFLTKPITATALKDSIAAALAEYDAAAARTQSSHTIAARLAALTEREREVMALALEGLANKEIARRLDISHRTVEIHRARVLHKTGVHSLLELQRLVAAGGTTA